MAEGLDPVLFDPLVQDLASHLGMPQVAGEEVSWTARRLGLELRLSLRMSAGEWSARVFLADGAALSVAVNSPDSAAALLRRMDEALREAGRG